jgi:very-short-patch-repair endonuclease
LSHRSAAVLWGICRVETKPIQVSMPAHTRRQPAGIKVHRRKALTPADTTVLHTIPVTTPACTLIDISTQLEPNQIEAVINEADKLELITPEELRLAVDKAARRPGVRALREILDHRTFRLTDSELERRFLRLVRKARLPLPQTGQSLNGFKVDFYWPDLRLVVETDGLRYHRTPAQQAKDLIRDQAHTSAGLTTLRFTHAQVVHEPERVTAILGNACRR